MLLTEVVDLFQAHIFNSSAGLMLPFESYLHNLLFHAKAFVRPALLSCSMELAFAVIVHLSQLIIANYASFAFDVHCTV